MGTHGHTVLALTIVAPADTPIEPITEDLIAIAVLLPEWEPVCSSYAAVDELAMSLSLTIGDPAMYTLLTDMADDYLVDTFEDGFGEAAALTVEAEELLRDSLHDCA